MVEFSKVTEYKAGIVFSLLRRSFAEIIDGVLEEKMREFDGAVFENIETVGACAFVTILNGEAVGMVSWDSREGPELGVVGWNCVLPEFRGRGFGKMQIEEVLGRLKGEGFKRVVVRTGEHPFFAAARRMYVACGFREVRRSPTGDQEGYGTIDYEVRFGGGS